MVMDNKGHIPQQLYSTIGRKPIPAPRPVRNDQNTALGNAQTVNAQNQYFGNDISDDNLYGDPTLTLQEQLEKLRNTLKNKILNNETQQSRCLAALEILKLNIAFFPKYKVVDFWKMLKANEHSPINVYLETFDILERYACNLLKPIESRHKSWRLINFRTAVYQKIGSVKTVNEVLQSLGYKQKTMQNDGTIIGLEFPQNMFVQKNIVLEIAADLSLAKFEMEALTKETHPQIETIANDPLFPKHLLPLKKMNAQSQNFDKHKQRPVPVRRADQLNKPLSPVTCVNSPSKYTYSPSISSYSMEDNPTSITPSQRIVGQPQRSPDDSPINYALTTFQMQSMPTSVLGGKISPTKQFPKAPSLYAVPHYEEVEPNLKRQITRRNMFCPNCGENCGEIAKFCKSCGNKLNRDQNFEPGYEPKSMDTMLKEKSKQSSPEKPLPFEENGWFCDNCTYYNTDINTNICKMCYRTSDRRVVKEQKPEPMRKNVQTWNSNISTAPRVNEQNINDIQTQNIKKNPIPNNKNVNLEKQIDPPKGSIDFSYDYPYEFSIPKQDQKNFEGTLNRRQLQEKKKQDELREIENAKKEVQNTEELVKAIKCCDNKGYDPEKCILASKLMEPKSYESEKIILWLEKDLPIHVRIFIDYCYNEYQGDCEKLIEHKEALEIFIEAEGDIKKGFEILVNKRQHQIEELLIYGMFTQEELMNALCDCDGDLHESRNLLSTKSVLLRDPHFFDELLQPPMPLSTDYDESLEMLKQEGISEEFKCYLLMGEFNLSWGRAGMCLKLINEGRNIMYCIRAVQDTYDVNQVRKNLAIECQVCLGDVSIYETITSTHCQCQICWDCYANFLKHNVLNMDIEALVCPYCAQPKMDEQPRNYFEFIEQQIIDLVKKNKLEANISEIFSSKLRDYYLIRDPNFRWCKFCDHGFIWEQQDRLQTTCNRCRNSFCFECGEKWEPQHEGITCENFKAWKEANSSDQAGYIDNMLRNNQLVCPKCNQRFDLAHGGCMHFTCSSRACNFEFCSGCFQEMISNRQQCHFDIRCKKIGLHGHHPRDCLYYLRDFDVADLKTLLDDQRVPYEIDIPDYKQEDADAAGENVCYINTTEETPDGIRDVPCGRQAGVDTAGLCEKHYREHLTYLINLNQIDPVDVLDVEKINPIFQRHFLEVPQQENGETPQDYVERLREELKDAVPLPERTRNQSLPKLI